MITTPEIFCDLCSFLDKDQIERIQLVNHFWNNVIIRHKNILPLRKFRILVFHQNRITLLAYDDYSNGNTYTIKFDGTNLSKGKVYGEDGEENVISPEYMSPRYSQLTVDEVLNNLNDIVFENMQFQYRHLDDFLKLIKLFKTKTGGRFRVIIGYCCIENYDSILAEIFDNHIIVDQLALRMTDSYIREICANPEIVQLPSTPKEIRLTCLEFKENDEVLHFICNGKLNGANRVTIELGDSDISNGNFIRQWFELYLTHQNPISLVGKFELQFYHDNRILDAVKTFLNNTQLRVKYSLEKKEIFFIRRCVLHETGSYALVIEIGYEEFIDMSNINASDLDQPPCDKISTISFCVKSL